MRTLMLVLSAAACSLVAAGCGGGLSQEGQPSSPDRVEESSAAESRRPAPSIQGISLDGKSIALSDFRGRPVLVNVWSSW